MSPGTLTCCLSSSSGCVSQNCRAWGWLLVTAASPCRGRMLSESPGVAAGQDNARGQPQTGLSHHPSPSRSCSQPLPEHINQRLPHQQISISQLSSSGGGTTSRNVSRETGSLLLLLLLSSSSAKTSLSTTIFWDRAWKKPFFPRVRFLLSAGCCDGGTSMQLLSWGFC